VVDPNTYSSGDLFAAGFVDNQLGPLVCVSGRAAGAARTVWAHEDVREALAGTEFAIPDLPSDVGYTSPSAARCAASPPTACPSKTWASRDPYAITRGDLQARTRT
jgi:hypothetical protein